GDGEARDEIAAMFAAFGDRVRMHGAVPLSALPAIYAAADLHVWPALNEAYGMALLEAQAAGLPVVAGREGGVPDVVVDGVTGLLAEPRSVPAFAAAVRRLLLDPARRRAMGASARERVLVHHDLPIARTRLSAALAGFRTMACASA
ncbi:MAG: glycosyltransferase family 4 protein, partial [Geminicoccaceae bacterium]